MTDQTRAYYSWANSDTPELRPNCACLGDRVPCEASDLPTGSECKRFLGPPLYVLCWWDGRRAHSYN